MDPMIKVYQPAGTALCCVTAELQNCRTSVVLIVNIKGNASSVARWCCLTD